MIEHVQYCFGGSLQGIGAIGKAQAFTVAGKIYQETVVLMEVSPKRDEILVTAQESMEKN